MQVTISYAIEATNTGVQHDLICGCSLLDPSTGEPLYDLPWWVIWNVPSGKAWNVTIQASGDIQAGTYLAIAKAWENHVGGTKVGDLKLGDGTIVGALYQAGTGTLTGELDRETKTLVVGEVPGEVSATIDNFTITI